MKILSPEECQEWVETRLAKGFTRETLEAHFPHCVSYELPLDAGERTAIARAVSVSLETSQPGLFWITAWGIFPSSENVALFDGYRKSLGEDRSVQAAPGHVFGESDVKQLECLLDLTLYFGLVELSKRSVRRMGRK